MNTKVYQNIWKKYVLLDCTAVLKTISHFPMFLGKKGLFSDNEYSHVQINKLEYILSLPLGMTYWEK